MTLLIIQCTISEVTLTTDMMDKPETPSIRQLYDQPRVKHLPGKDRKGNGEFVDWGTKLYQLELELSFKTNEIVVLQKKLQKYVRELYPGGDSNKVRYQHCLEIRTVKVDFFSNRHLKINIDSFITS